MRRVKISVGVKTKKLSGHNGQVTIKKTFFFNAFADLSAMQDDKKIFSIKTDNFPALIELINKNPYCSKLMKFDGYSAHNGWTHSQSTSKPKNGLTLGRQDYQKVCILLDDIFFKKKKKSLKQTPQITIKEFAQV